MNTPIIEIQHLTKQYRHSKEFALRGIDLSIQPGEFFGLLGPNGCGKTTIISILVGLIKSTDGIVHIKGKHMPKELSQFKPLIGLVPQDLALYPTLTLRENLRFFGKLYGLKGKKLKERVERCIEIAALEHYAKWQIQTFSGGMKRRANIVISLLHNPEILILDEPTVNVDPQSRNVIFDILKELNRDGITIIYTTHYLEEAEELCNRVAIVDHGKVIECDSPKNLIAKTPNADNLGEVFLHLTGHDLRDEMEC